MTPLYRFGPFELDVRAGELRKYGTRIRLQEQPLRILTMLLARPGDAVLREEIQQALGRIEPWSSSIKESMPRSNGYERHWEIRRSARVTSRRWRAAATASLVCWNR